MFFKVNSHLSQHIENYWLWDEVNPQTLPWILPSNEVELVFHINHPPTIHTIKNEIFTVPSIHWVGPQSRRWKLISSSNLKLISVRFIPGAVWEIFGLDTSLLSNQFPTFETSHLIKLQDLIRIFQTHFTNYEQNINLLENHLLGLVEDLKSKKKEIDAAIKFTYSELVHSNKRVSEIAKEISLSRKQIERGIKKVYGLPPGEIRKIQRILSLVRNPDHYKSENLEVRLTDIAYDFGYTDQSHLIHDFKSVTGYLPKEWFQNFDKMSHFYNSKRVL
jgi:AraC-like DNA-binding protein